MTLCESPRVIESALILFLHHLATQLSVKVTSVMAVGLFEFFVENSTFSNVILVIVVSGFS